MISHFFTAPFLFAINISYITETTWCTDLFMINKLENETIH